MTKKYAVLGSPIEHSLSPKIHNFIFASLGVDATYERFEVSSNLGDFLEQKDDHSGFSLTMPLKDQAYALARTLSPDAKATGSVNTLLRTNYGFAGFNTDVYGIKSAVAVNPTQVAVLGSGATARSALRAFPNSDKLVWARNTGAASELSSSFGSRTVSLEEALSAEVVISTLPAGAFIDIIPEGTELGVVLDVSYVNPPVDAKKYISGLEMLMLQAIAQQRIFQAGNETEPLENEAKLLSELRSHLNMAK